MLVLGKRDCVQNLYLYVVFTPLPLLCARTLWHVIALSFLLRLISFSFLPQNEIASSKVLFPEHLPLSRVQAGIKSGSFLQGTFRASRDNYLEATVFIQGEGEDSTEVCVCVCVHFSVTMECCTF